MVFSMSKKVPKNKKSPNPTWGEVWDIAANHTDLIIKQQLFVHKWAKNIRTGGDFAESHFRSLLKRILPERFAVTTGHIVAPGSNKEPAVSPQCDIIIVDKMVPHSLLPFKKDEIDFDIVPIEAVVAIFEVKSTLTTGSGKNSLYSACEHLKSIAEKINLPLAFSYRFLPGGMRLEPDTGVNIRGGHSANPLIGILSGTSFQGFNKKQTSTYIQEVAELMMPFRLDVALSIDGKVLAPFDEKGNFMMDPPREKDTQKKLQYLVSNESLSRTQIIARSLGAILAYLKNTTGRQYDPTEYYFF